ncbi:MAG TPA: hypothetical protein VER04_02295 [Polyangiaceae bacterium]|nr:hypothetical protein [Polyangiaceae bacterium]
MASFPPGAAPRPSAWPALALFVGGALFALGCTSAAPASADDSSLPPVADDSCARFGFRFSPGGCPEAECAEPLCSCPAAIGCIPGKNERCMSGVACSVACSADFPRLLACAVDIAPCRLDTDCNQGLCVVEPAALDGECESGERGARCRNDQDCKVGNCVAGDGGNRACSPGEADDLCNRASDCQSARCALAAGATVGSCEG